MAAKRSFDPVLFTLVLLLSAGGLLMIYSASAVISEERYGHPYQFLERQLFALLIGLAGMALLMKTDYRLLQSPWVVWTPFVLVLASLLVALASAPVNGTHRWVRLFGLSFQPSEFAKVALLLVLADQLSRRQAEMNRLRGPVVICLTATAVVVALVARQPDLGTSAVIALLSFTVLFAAGLRWRYVLLPAAALAAAGAVTAFTTDYMRRRIEIFINPDLDPSGAGYQVRQSIVAVASGGVGGRGLGEGGQKLFFLPYPHTDFIFSNIAEEAGLIGSLALVAAFLLVTVRGLRAASRAPNLYLSLVATGVTVLIAGQAFINMGVCLGLLPAKGLPLPFISYGGSSLVTSLLASGLLLNASQHGS